MTFERYTRSALSRDPVTRERQLQAQRLLQEAREKTQRRKRDTRRKIIVGGALLAHAELHPAFRVALRDALRSAVTRDIDRNVIAELLIGD
jgi:hypothetical protein